eukprot:Selendium_serpulae@DN3904_c0_g1_i2.p1
MGIGQLVFLPNSGPISNSLLLLWVAIINLIFIIEVLRALFYEFAENIRHQKAMQSKKGPVGAIARWLTSIAERRRTNGGVVVYDSKTSIFKIVTAQRHKFLNFIRLRHKKPGQNEREYFVKIISAMLSHALLTEGQAKLPGDFVEFMLLYTLTYHSIQDEEKGNKNAISQMADGDLDMIIDYQVAQKQKQLEQEVRKKQEEPEDEEFDELYEQMCKDVEMKEVEDEDGEQAAQVPKLSTDIKALLAENEVEVTRLFDEELLSSGVSIADLYLGLLALELESPDHVRLLFKTFKAKRLTMMTEELNALKTRHAKLSNMMKLLTYQVDYDSDLEHVDEGRAETALSNRDLAVHQLQETEKEIDNLRDDPEAWVDEQFKLLRELNPEDLGMDEDQALELLLALNVQDKIEAAMSRAEDTLKADGFEKKDIDSLLQDGGFTSPFAPEQDAPAGTQAGATEEEHSGDDENAGLFLPRERHVRSTVERVGSGDDEVVFRTVVVETTQEIKQSKYKRKEREAEESRKLLDDQNFEAE